MAEGGRTVGVDFGRFASIGRNSRGHYVHVGADGLSCKIVPGPQAETEIPMREIDSGETLYIRDADSREIVEEINARYRKLPLWPLGVIAGIVLYPWISIYSLFAAAPLVMLLALVDRKRKTTVIVYEFDASAGEKFHAFCDAFEELMRADRKWHVAASGHVGEKERKVHAGAEHVVRRTPIRIGYSLPKYVRTNVKVPCVPVGRQRLYFFPDRVLIVENRKAGAVSYGKLTLERANVEYIEEEDVPKDTRVVGHTWKYVKKDGGPDKRFKNNRQLPVCLYAELWFRSDTGLNEKILVSAPDAGTRLMDVMEGMTRP